MVQIILELLLKQKLLAVCHDFHWLLAATKLLTAKLHSRYMKESESDILPRTPTLRKRAFQSIAFRSFSFVRSRKDLLVDAGGCSWRSRSRTRFRVRLRSKTSMRSFTAIRTFRAKSKCSRTKSPPSPDVSLFPGCAICSRRCCWEDEDDRQIADGRIYCQCSFVIDRKV